MSARRSGAFGLLVVAALSLAAFRGPALVPLRALDSQNVALGPWPGLAAPAVSGRALDGRFFSLHEYAAQSGAYVLLNFWASWCGPCREEMPLLALVHEAWGESAGGATAAVRVAAVNVKETAREVSAFFADALPSFPILLDDGTAAADYLIWGVPTTFLIDPHGRIVARIQGPITPPRLCSALEDAGVAPARCPPGAGGALDGGEDGMMGGSV